MERLERVWEKGGVCEAKAWHELGVCVCVRERGETGLINRVKGGGTCRHHRHEISMLFCGTEGSLLVQSRDLPDPVTVLVM